MQVITEGVTWTAQERTADKKNNEDSHALEEVLDPRIKKRTMEQALLAKQSP